MSHPVYSQPSQPVRYAAQPVQHAAQPAPKNLANRAAGVGVLGLILAGVGILLALFLGTTATNLALVSALVIGGGIVVVISLVFCIVFTVQKR